MNATCKRLLSWLVVVTMVLSMVPVFDLSNFAVTTKAAENPGQAAIDTATTVKTEIEGLRDKFAGATGTVTAVCPVCSRDDKNAVTEEVEWTPISGDALAEINHPAPSSGYVHYHYYLSDDADFSGYAFTFGGNNNYVCLNLNGKAMTTGNTAFHVNYGDRVAVMDSAETDGSITGTKTSGNAAAVFNLQNPNGRINIYGGNFKRSNSCGTYTNVVMVQGLGGVVNMYGGTIDANKDITNAGAYPAGVYLLANDSRTATFNMYGGTITGANSSADGGSVCATVRTTFNMYGGTVSDGTARGGGNFYVNGGTLNVYGGTISGGTATHASVVGGGNILVHASGKLHMEGGVVSGGKASGIGGNIAVRASNVGTVEISGGKIYGGTAKNNANGHNIYVGTAASFLTISGGEIAGDIITGSGVTTTLSGEPKIMTSGLYAADGTTAVTGATGLNVTSTSEISVTGVTGGEIQVTGTLGTVFSKTGEDASAAAQYFSNTDATLDVVANADNKLEIVEYVEPSNDPVWGVFDPAGCGGLAYCEHCGQAAGPQTWEAISGTGLAAMTYGNNTKPVHYHYYLSGTVSFTGNAFTFSGNNNNICLNLNGQTMTTGNRAFVVTYGNTVSVMDTEGGSVTGKYTGQNATVFYLSNPNAKVNVYGGTFKRSTDSATSSSVVRIENLGGTFTMYGGTIDANGPATNNAQPGVYMTANVDDNRQATFHMRGGQIIGATTSGDGGAVYLANAAATFNMHSGTISGGSGRAGGNIMVYTGALNIYGGTISGGKSTNNNAFVTGGNIALRNGASLYMEGGVVCNGEAVQNGGNIALWNSVNTVEIVGGKIYGGVATGGANIYNNGAAGSALTIGGTAEIAGDIVTNHNTTNTLSGTPKIKTSGLYAADGTTPVTGTQGYEVKSNTNLNVSGLTGGEIEVTAANKGIVFAVACENAATVAEYFSSTTEGTTVAANTDNQLYIAEEVDPTVPVVGVFNPEGCNGYAYCPVCEGEPVLWTKIDKNFVGGTVISANNAGAHDHVYLAEDISGDVAVGGYFLATGNNNRICLNLNGKKLNVTNGRAFMRNFCYAYWKIMDTEGGAEVSGNGVFRLDAAGNRTVDVYGGTFKTNNDNSIVEIGGNGGTFNLHGGTLDATGASVGAIGAQGKKTSGATATINVYGGEIIGNGDIAIRVGSVLQANATTSFMGCATFTMTDGTISGGYVQVRNDNTATISGGTIEYLTIYDGAYEEGGSDNAEADYSGVTTVTLTGAPKIAQMAIGENVVVNIDGLTEGAKVAIDGKVGVTLIETTNATAQGCIEAYRDYLYVAINGNAISLAQMQASVVTAEGETFYPTLVEAMTNVGDGYVALYADGLTVTISDDTYIDNRGYAVTVDGEGTLYAMDAANDDYNGYGSWTVDSEDVTVINDVINPVNGNRYIVIKNEMDGNAYSAHRVELYLTHASLRTSAAGLYYKAQYKCDTALADRVMSYGIVFSATRGEVHQGNFDADNDVYSMMDGFKANMVDNTVNGTSTEVFGIFKSEGRTADDNVAAGVAKVHATPYINVDCDDNGVSDADPFVIGNVQNDVYDANKAGVTYAAMSLYDVLKAINDNWAAYAEVQGQVQGFYNDWADYGMSQWATDLANISGTNA